MCLYQPPVCPGRRGGASEPPDAGHGPAQTAGQEVITHAVIRVVVHVVHGPTCTALSTGTVL